MSRIGRKPIPMPKGVSLVQKAGQFGVKGPKGELTKPMPSGITIKLEGDKVVISRTDDSGPNRAKHGLVRAHLANMVKGVTEGWKRELEINGVGYRAEVSGDSITFALGYSHPIVFKLPKSITAKVEKNRLTLLSSRQGRAGQSFGQDSRIASARALQGQGREVRRRDHQEEGW
jgi:large subunit ribosomal protein L6